MKLLTLDHSNLVQFESILPTLSEEEKNNIFNTPIFFGLVEEFISLPKYSGAFIDYSNICNLIVWGFCLGIKSRSILCPNGSNNFVNMFNFIENNCKNEELKAELKLLVTKASLFLE